MDPVRARAKLVAAFDQADWPRVQYRAEQLLAAVPADAAAHFMLGMAHAARHRDEEAITSLREACRLEPRRPEYLARYAAALASAGQASAAHEAAARAEGLAQGDARVLAVLGQAFLQINAIEPASRVLRRAATLAPVDAHLRFTLGRTLEMLGDAPGAERELHACVENQPRYWPAYLRLAMLKRQTAVGRQGAEWRELLAKNDGDPGAQIFLNMALGKESEDRGDYAAAFRYFTIGKAAARRTRPASSERDSAMFDALLRWSPEPDARSGMGFAPASPVFIVGMPRTGTTLLDRMLSNHPDVHSLGETQRFATALQRATGTPVALLSLPDIAGATRDIDWTRLGAAYMENTEPAGTGKPRLVDKLPHNFLYLGFIARALPDARIVCLRRDALDTCIGNFRHLFEMQSGFYDYSLDLMDIGRYYVGFERLLAHWHATLPGRILQVDYEELVRGPEATLRRVLAFCDLPWNDACVRPQDNLTPVRTPNAWQVRGPIYTSSIGYWRHYGSELGPLRDMLLGAGVHIDVGEGHSHVDAGVVRA